VVDPSGGSSYYARRSPTAWPRRPESFIEGRSLGMHDQGCRVGSRSANEEAAARRQRPSTGATRVISASTSYPARRKKASRHPRASTTRAVRAQQIERLGRAARNPRRSGVPGELDALSEGARGTGTCSTCRSRDHGHGHDGLARERDLRRHGRRFPTQRPRFVAIWACTARPYRGLRGLTRTCAPA